MIILINGQRNASKSSNSPLLYAADPQILIADEPTDSLRCNDSSNTIFKSQGKIQEELHYLLFLLLATLSVVAGMADRVVVNACRCVVEYGTVDQVFYNPNHPTVPLLLDIDYQEEPPMFRSIR